MSGDSTQQGLPLKGCRILVTRAQEQAATLSDKIGVLGGEAVEFPVIEIQPPTHPEILDTAINRLKQIDWVVFTSVNGVHAFWRRLSELQVDTRQMEHVRVAAVGPKTAAAVEEKGVPVDYLPQEYRAEALIEVLRSQVKPGDQILLPRANIARPLLAQKLRELGCDVIDAPAYDTRPSKRVAGDFVRVLEEGPIDVITFTSSSTVRAFIQALQGETIDLNQYIHQTHIACIGPITAETARKMDLKVDVIAEPYTIDGLIEAITRLPKKTKEESR
ncbi:uroporphyrinogen-III synthase [Desmospora activa]|uniref:Uroporphyrinogen-III synthase n=1 Tax=Desmospora activa DSM 45169 TaxID=1121389 RepID=A0A2T4Z8N2_9BACL|nr:uroporphyrinogen-III synthase [Desmospora activa]PTM58242.1 uroporphyrinogen-III synthase [Desmospora activa DSM 45169]